MATSEEIKARLQARWEEIQDGRWTDPAAPRITAPVDYAKRERDRWAEADRNMRDTAEEWQKHLAAERERARQRALAEAEAIANKLTG